MWIKDIFNIKKIKADLASLQAEKDELFFQKSKLSDEVDRLKSKNSSLLDEQEKLIASNSELVSERDSLKAEQEHLIEVTTPGRISALSSRINTLKEEIKQLEEKKKTDTAQAEKELEELLRKNQKVKYAFDALRKAIRQYDRADDYEDAMDAIYLAEDFAPEVELPLNCMNVKQLRTLYNQNKKIIQSTLISYEQRYTTKTNKAIYKLMIMALEAELQNILYNIKYSKLDDALESVKNITQKYYLVCTQGNQTIAPTMRIFIAETESLYSQAVKIEYEYYVQKERAKEEQKALREQMKQEAEERKLLEAEQKKVQAEELKYKNEIDNISEQIKSNTDDEKVLKLKARLAELEKQLSEVSAKKEQIVNLQNGKAGYVYVISNLGSFGDNVFKIGMTRRLDPVDRIKELSSASVPFSFDIHCFIFSEDAVSLEAELHRRLNNCRVNRVNMRKEFFRVSVDELEKLVYSINPSAEFNRTMIAEQYRQGLSVKNVVELETDDNDDDE